MARRLAALFLLLIALALPAEVSGKAAATPPPAPDGTQYHALSPALVSNVQSDGKPRFLRCEIQLMTRQTGAVAQLELHTAPLRHALLLLFAEQDAMSLTTPAGKDALRTAALDAVRAVLQDKAGQPLVDDLYFTSFYVQ
jgi:flagellar FliL protein